MISTRIRGWNSNKTIKSKGQTKKLLTPIVSLLKLSIQRSKFWDVTASVFPWINPRGNQSTTCTRGFPLVDKAIEQQFNRAHNAVRAIGERGNSLLKTAFKALRNVSLCPWAISRITAAALVILHVEHGRTT